MFVLRTRLINNPDVSFYYNGTATEEGAPFALNTIVAFEPADAMIFNKQTALALCEKLNQDKSALKTASYTEFEVVIR